jgi:hypothetical protein
MSSNTGGSTTSDPEITAAVDKIGAALDTYGPTLNTASSPAAVETIGRGLAQALRSYRPGALAIWNTRDDAILAHVVARELGVIVLRADETDGVAALQPTGQGTRTVFLAAAWDDPRRIAVSRTLMTAGNAKLAALAAVFGTPALQAVKDVPTVYLTGAAWEVSR